MANIMPISELIEDPLKISKLCHSQDEPVFLTKDGYGDMVVMSIEQYETLKTQAMSNVAKQKVLENTAKSTEAEKIEAESSLREGIQKLPLEDVYDILKEELERQRNNINKKRFP
ncbi:hypothetical protein CCDG5_0083 [[Clostridium] cellulosi]|jgi:Phd_YefM.|uniref:Antitoxin n=1 Tax=[Clostridium] cellulosi TaxID=29343 RepID=A0A078KL85_9FIRM|nr:hypothetical protein CCDG5_0083 [[Clostridium] cellulosi]